jgi:tetratricopeptide (TPR) repeat protein
LDEAADALFGVYRSRNWFVEGEEQFRIAALAADDGNRSWARLAARQAYFAAQLGQNQIAQTLLERCAASHASLALPIQELAFCRLTLANVALRQGAYPVAEQAAGLCLANYQACHDLPGSIQALNTLGNIALGLGNYVTARTRFEQALRLAGADNAPPAPAAPWAHPVADSMRGLGNVCWHEGDYAAAQDNYTDAVRRYQDLHVQNRQGAAATLNELGFIAWSQQRYREASTYYQQALIIFRQIGDRHGEASALDSLGLAAEQQYKYAESQRYYEAALELAQLLGDQRSAGATFANFGFLAFHQGDYGAAYQGFTQAAQLHQAIGHRRGEALALACLGLSAHLCGEDAAPEISCRQAVVVAQAIGKQPVLGYALVHLGYVLLGGRKGETPCGNAGDKRIEAAQASFQEALRVRQALGDHDRATEALAGLAQIAQLRGQMDEALAYCRQIVDFLATGTLARALLPFQVYAVCCSVLAVHADARSELVLDQARELLKQRTQAIADPRRARAFLHAMAAQFGEEATRLIQRVTLESREASPSHRP